MIGDLIKIQPSQVSTARKKPRKPPLWRRTWVRVLVLTVLLTGLGGYVWLMIYLRPFREKAMAYDLTAMGKLEVSTLIHDRNGQVIGELAEENRRTVTLDKIPQHFINALVAAEDGRFFEHRGVDYWGIARAYYWTYIRNQGHQGGSTITQQLARQTYGQQDKTLMEKSKERKLTEMFLARRIEENFTKAEILEMYLNRIYFGSGCWGVNTAALRYFSKPVSQLTLPESAMLCGLIKRPDAYSPLKDLQAATRNRNQVLERMAEENLLGRAEADAFKAQPLVINPSQTIRGGGNILDEINAELEPILEAFGYEDLAGKGLHIHTSLDADLQKAAEESVKRRLDEIEARKEYADWLKEVNHHPDRREKPRAPHSEYVRTYEAWQKSAREAAKAGQPEPLCPEPTYLQAAVVMLDNKSGEILAMVGGRDWNHNKINLAQAKPGRSPGTAFYPFVYAAAFEEKMFPGTRLSDEPLDNSRIMVGSLEGILGEWGREGQTDKFLGKITARGALVQSMNGATARMGLDLGLPKIRDFAFRAGLADVKDLPASILGTSECTLRDLTLAYTTFPNQGVRPSGSHLVTKITDMEGRVIWQRPEHSDHVTVTDPITAYMITSCLEDAMSIGTGSPAKEFGLKEIPCAGKTGTPYDFRDLWFVGYTSSVTCGVWTGMRDRPETVYPGAFSSRCALPIWVDAINASLARHPAGDLPKPADIQTVDLCAESGLRATDRCYQVQDDPLTKRKINVQTAYQEFVRPGFKLDQVCDVHAGEDPLAKSMATPEVPVILTPEKRQGNASATTASVSPIPVAVKGPVVIGNDPYQAMAPVIAAEKTAPKEGAAKSSAGTEILQTPDLRNKTKINLPEPPPLKIE